MDQAPPPHDRTILGMSWIDLRGRIKEVVFFLPYFLKNPVEGIKRVPSWDWPTILILDILLSAVTGAAEGVVAGHVISIFLGGIMSPIRSLCVSLILAGTLYYLSLFMLKTQLEFRKMFIVVVLSQIPMQILQVLLPIARPLTLIGIIFTALLLIVGLVENFMLDRKKVRQIVVSITAVVIVLWIIGTIRDATRDHLKAPDYTPESLDQIYKELGEGK